jgi:predicted amidohydrolase
MSELLRVGLVQLTVRTNRTEDNLTRAKALVSQAARQGCRLVVLPEAFATGLNLPRSHQLAEPVPGQIAQWLADLATAEGLYLVAGQLEAADGEVYSSAVVIDDAGELLDVYRRSTVYDLERHFITAGSGSRVIETPIGRLGVILGYDVQFPEVMRGMFADGVELLVCPSLLLQPFASSIRQMVLARAAENCCYVLFCSATGENTLAGLTYLGDSCIAQCPVGIRSYANQFRPQPAVVAAAERDECLVTAELSMADLRRLQAANPLVKDFRRTSFCDVLVTASRRHSPDQAGVQPRPRTSASGI